MKVNWDDALEDIRGDVVGLVKEAKQNFTDGFFSSEVKKERYHLCKSCDRFNNTVKTCNECGCFMPMKTLMVREKCPIGKW